MTFLKEYFEKFRVLNFVYSALWQLLLTQFFFIDGKKKRYPTVLQLPITNRCNSRCVMCNIPQMGHANELSVEQFKRVIGDPIFKKVRAVGINGGEPTLVADIIERTKVVIDTLPQLKHLNIISNGFLPNKLLSELFEIYEYAKSRSIKFHVSISLDGYREIHDKVRGVDGAFLKTMATIDALNGPRQYCDSFDVGCTVTKQNVDHLVELAVFAKDNSLPIKYRLAVPIRRIDSFSNYDDYSIFTSEKAKQSATEFFFSLLSTSISLNDKLKYYCIFKYLIAHRPKRLMGCAWKENGITLDPKGTLYYCAVESDPLGNLLENKGEEIFFSEEHIKHRTTIINSKCNSCIHDYGGKIPISSLCEFYKDLVASYLTIRKFKLWK